MAEWVDEIILVKETVPADGSRVDGDGFPVQQEEEKRARIINLSRSSMAFTPSFARSALQAPMQSSISSVIFALVLLNTAGRGKAYCFLQ